MKIPVPSDQILVYGEDWRSLSAKVGRDDCKTTVLPRAVPKICFAFGKRLGEVCWFLVAIFCASHTANSPIKIMQIDAT
jgi:hypothetical protein